MKFLKWTFGIGLTLLIAAVLAAPYFVGRSMEKESGALSDVIVETFPGLELVETEYERGWFVSHARDLYAIGGTPAFEVCHTIHHGPFPFVKGENFKFRVGMVESLVSIVSDCELPSLNLLTALNFNEECVTSASLPAFELEKEAGRLSWEALTGQVVFNLADGSSVVELELPSLTFHSERGDVSLTRVALGGTLDLSNFITFYPSGHYQCGAEQITVSLHNVSEPVTVDWRKPSASVHYLTDGDVVDAGCLYEWEGLEVNKTRIGKMRCNVAVNSLDLATYERMVDLGSGGDAAAQLAFLLPDLFSRSPVMTLSLDEMATEKGELSGQLRIAIDGPSLEGVDPCGNPVVWLEAVALATHWSVPTPLLEAGACSATWSVLVATLAPFIVIGEKKSTIDFGYESGVVSLNGFEGPLDEFVCAVMEVAATLQAE